MVQSPQSQVSNRNFLLSFLGCAGAILVFALIIYLAYLPTRPEPVDASVVAEREAKANELMAASIQKLSNFEVINAEEGLARIPIEDAMKLTIESYQSGPRTEGDE
jgi:hypothetical protein